MSETKTFQTEVQQLLDLVIHSLYSNREIFLRELISNSSDAIDRARFESVTQDAVKEPEGGWKIKLFTDAEANTLTIVDNGIGMNREEVESNIGTIANSGTKAFLKNLKESESKDQPEMIGQFGVGFYAAFMVADKVELETLRADNSAPAVSWLSNGDGTYELDESDRSVPGTKITLHLKEDCKQYLETWPLREIIKKYSDYVAFPIVMDVERPVESDDEPEEGEEPKEPVMEIVEETLNSMKAIWTRPASEIKDEEYNEFYKALSKDWTDPAKTIHYVAEGTLEYRALLYIPGRRPMDLFNDNRNPGLHLYVKRVFIMGDCEDLLPMWLRFVRGVVDSSDLSLNVSREILQENTTVKKIQKTLVNKVLSTLKSMKKKEEDAYLTFFKQLGTLLKEGIHSDAAQRDKLKELMLFESSKIDADKMTDLKSYVARMHPDQDAIYYITADSRDAAENSPHLEAFNAKGYEVLYLVEPIDEWMLQSLTEYDEKKLQPVNQGDVDLLNEDEKAEADKKRETDQKTYGDLLGLMQEHLTEEIKEVRFSDRLTESACCLVADEAGMNANMERIMASMGQDMPKSKRILELNAEHPVLKRMQDVYDADKESGKLKDFSELLYGQALLTEGSPVKQPLRFAKLVSDLMVGS